MATRIPARACLGALMLASAACNAPSLDQLWSADEQRLVYPTPRALGAEGARAPHEYAIFVPLGVDRVGLALSASESLVLGKNVTITEPSHGSRRSELAIVSSLGEVSVGAHASFGALYDLGSRGPHFEEGVAVAKYVKSAAPLTGEPPIARPDAIVSNLKPFTEEYRWSVHPPNGAQGAAIVALEAGERVRPLAAGSYASLRIPAGGTARLEPGRYFFDALTLEPGGTLEIDNATGHVYVWVKQSLIIAGRMREYSLLPTSLFGYAGAEPPQILADFHGTLVAPRATVDLPATPEPHCGAFFARVIRLADDARLEHRTFGGWDTLFDDVSDACARCAIAGDLERRRCCAAAHPAPCAGGASCLGDQASGSGSSVPIPGADSGRALARSEALEVCLLGVMPAFLACEDSAQLAPEACTRLGHSYRPQRACGDF